MDGEIRLTISIALCTFNGERFLREQLDSFSHQTRLPDEVVVSDDGSTDQTLEILETWAKEVPFPVRIHRNPQNLGYAQNFQETMKRCIGDLIFPSDQDDWWAPEKLEKMAKVLEEQPELAYAACRTVYTDEDLIPISEEIMREKRMTCLSSASAYHMVPNATGCGMAIRKSMLEKVLPIPNGWPHDMWICETLPFFGESRFLEEELLHQRAHRESVTFRSIHDSWSQGRNVFYCLSTGQFRWHEGLRKTFRENLDRFPDGEYKNHCLKYYAHQETHFGNRLLAQERTRLDLAFLELLSGRYFRHPQPVKSFLFDVKEGVLNYLKRQKENKRKENAPTGKLPALNHEEEETR